MKIKYKIEFHFENFNQAELRELKINSIVSNNLISFESESCPRIPTVNELIVFGEESFRCLRITNSWESTDSEFIMNKIVIDVLSVRKEKEEEEKRQKEETDKKAALAIEMLKKYQKPKSNPFNDWGDIGKDYYGDKYRKKYNDGYDFDVWLSDPGTSIKTLDRGYKRGYNSSDILSGKIK